MAGGEDGEAAPERRVVLCADDFGLTEGTSRGILDLAALGRISATSVMANMPDWPRLAPDLRKAGGWVAVGLHLNLTTGSPLGAMPGLAPGGAFPSLGRLVRSAFARGFPAAEVHGEVVRQLDAFEQAMGRPPTFVDGHQHVQVLPGVREGLVRALAERGLAGRAWVRDPSDALAAILRRRLSAGKALVVKGLALGFAASLDRAGLAANRGFSGFSPLDGSVDPARVFGEALSCLGPRPVVMCHPGRAGDDALRGLDPAVESRPRELAYLSSEAFGALLAERRIALAPAP
jgi:predicted glycoside hydrolase/deacetylase ChbG (UPF0249 family)